MSFTIDTKGFNDVVNITGRVGQEISDSGITKGICLISCPGSTCAITTIEYEPGLVEDLKKALNKVAPLSDEYEHQKKWGDGNGYAHIRSALIKPFLSIPIENGKASLGTWQQIVFIDFDNRARQRKINLNIIS